MDKIPLRQITRPGASERFSIRDIGALLSGKDMVQELHRHNFFLVLALEKGKGEHSIDFTSYPVNDYIVFFLRPGQVHQLSLMKGSTGFLMQFDREFYSPIEESANIILRKVSNQNYCPLSATRVKKLFSILTFILEEYTEKHERFEDAIKAHLEILFIELLRQSKHPGRIAENKYTYSQERLEELLNLLETHITKHKQVAEYAGIMHLTPFQLNKITKETIGKTCSELIIAQILLEAKRILLATTTQVNEIAYSLGYEDPSYFIRFFKKHTGFSPDLFRKNFK
jgi:AraC family transcriptional activator of pobA